MPILAETSDAVQIATLITGMIASISLPYIAYLTAKLAADQRARAEDAAKAVVEVKKTLEISKTETDDKLYGLAEIGNATHTLVNSQLGEQLKLSAETSRFKADTLRADKNASKTDIAIAEAAATLAEGTLAEHQQKQQVVDAAARESLNRKK
jgi:hypothetical protein